MRLANASTVTQQKYPATAVAEAAALFAEYRMGYRDYSRVGDAKFRVQTGDKSTGVKLDFEHPEYNVADPLPDRALGRVLEGGFEVGAKVGEWGLRFFRD